MKIAGVVAVDCALLAGPALAQKWCSEIRWTRQGQDAGGNRRREGCREGLSAVARQYTGAEEPRTPGGSRAKRAGQRSQASPAKPKASKAEAKSADTKPGNTAK